MKNIGINQNLRSLVVKVLVTMTDLIIQSLEEEHDRAGAVVGGDGGGAQLVDVATVVHVDGPGLIWVKSNNGLREGT